MYTVLTHKKCHANGTTYPMHIDVILEVQQLLSRSVRGLVREKAVKGHLGVHQSVKAEGVSGQAKENVVFC